VVKLSGTGKGIVFGGYSGLPGNGASGVLFESRPS